MNLPAITSTFHEILKYVGAYLFGIVASILFTTVQVELAGLWIVFLYPILAPLGFPAFYFALGGPYLPSGVEYWLIFATGLIPFVAGAAAYFGWLPRTRAWNPLWIGFPIGFVGTSGVFYMAAASI